MVYILLQRLQNNPFSDCWESTANKSLSFFIKLQYFSQAEKDAADYVVENTQSEGDSPVYSTLLQSLTTLYLILSLETPDLEQGFNFQLVATKS